MVYETNCHLLTGLVINGALTWYMFGVTPLEAVGYTAVFFCASWVRHFALSTYFRKSQEKVDG